MSVEAELGLGIGLESVIDSNWPFWQASRPELSRVDDPHGLQGWMQQSGAAEADEVWYGLAWLASIDGGDDPVAARVLAWLLVPGAALLARRLQTLCHEIDHVVAAELWVLVRTFPLHRRNVAANLIWDLRARVLASCEAPATLQRRDPIWYDTMTGFDADIAARQAADREPSSLDELVDVLDWACAVRVISPAERDLLLLLVEASQDPAPRRGAHQGVLANEATASAAGRLGVCDRTVRRRASRTIRALAAAAPRYCAAA